VDYVFAGSDKTAAWILQAISSSQKPSLVITRKDAPFGRKKTITQTPVADIADSQAVKIVKTNDPTEALNDIIQTGASRGIIVSYGAILKDEVLDALEWFNVHFSLLPKYRGAAPVQRAIMDGNTDSGVSIFKLDEGMDTGDLFTQIPVDISDMNTAQALEKLADASIEPLLELLKTEQPICFSQAGDQSLAKKLDRAECFLDFKTDSESCLRIVNACNPEPIAWTTLQGDAFRIINAATTGISDPGTDHQIGQVTKVGKKIYVTCAGSTSLELITVQPFAKKEMPAIDWFNGVGEVILGN